MGININDLDSNFEPVGASLLSGNESIMDNLRELSEEELKVSGGQAFFSGAGGTFFSGGKKGKGAFFIQGQAPVSQPVFQQPVVQPVVTQPVVTQPVVQQPTTVGVPVTSFPVGTGGGTIDINVNSSSSSDSRADSY